MVPAFSSRAASSDTLKKYLSVGILAIALISLIKFLVSRAFLFKYPRTLKREAEEKRSLLPRSSLCLLALWAISGEVARLPCPGTGGQQAQREGRTPPFGQALGARRKASREEMLGSSARPSTGRRWKEPTYCDAEPQDIVVVTLRDHGFQHGPVVRLPVRHNHHDFGGAWPSAGSRGVSEISAADEMEHHDQKTGLKRGPLLRTRTETP